MRYKSNTVKQYNVERGPPALPNKRFAKTIGSISRRETGFLNGPLTDGFRFFNARSGESKEIRGNALRECGGKTHIHEESRSSPVTYAAACLAISSHATASRNNRAISTAIGSSNKSKNYARWSVCRAITDATIIVDHVRSLSEPRSPIRYLPRYSPRPFTFRIVKVRGEHSCALDTYPKGQPRRQLVRIAARCR